jgi:mannitol/fructose-specific phosphotransferase system IIA component (Ntr-type)
MSTGIGFETAFPHSKTSSVIDFFITIGISHAGVDWQAFDKKPIKMVFLIGGLVEEQEKYLRILAALSKILSNEDYRHSLLRTSSTKEFYELFCQLAIIENQAI